VTRELNEGTCSPDVLELPSPDGTMYCRSKGICPTAPPFSCSRLEDYLPVVGEEKIERLSAAAARIKGAKILELNSSPIGGGVAEMLVSSVPLLNQLGIYNDWKVIRGTKPFYETTKCIHPAFPISNWGHRQALMVK